jgi:nucleotide-binding universal stress UspA family protein
MTRDRSKVWTIVVGLDYSELGDLAFDHACSWASSRDRVHVHVAHVQNLTPPAEYGALMPPLMEPEEAATTLKERVEGVLTRWCRGHDTLAPFETLTTHVLGGAPAPAIAQLASDVEADLVVVGTHGRRGAKRLLLGSVAEGTVRLAPCAVLVVRPPDTSVPQIEPPCTDCVDARKSSNGRRLWCARHSEHHGRRHTMHYAGAPGARQSGFLIHTR